MKLRTVGTIVATRKLVLSNGKTVMVRIGKPRRFRGGNDDYYCPFQIRGLGNEAVRYAGGVDSVQALQLVMAMIGVVLGTSPEAKAGDLSWDARTKQGDFGFPEN